MRSHSFGSQIFKLFNSKNAYNRLKQTYFRPRFLDGLRFFILFNYMSSCFQLNIVNDFRVVFNLLSFVLSEVHVLLMLFVFIYVYWCPTRFPYQMMYVLIYNCTASVTRGVVNDNPSGEHEFISVSPKLSFSLVSFCPFYFIHCIVCLLRF
jgi:hypothetical protein